MKLNYPFDVNKASAEAPGLIYWCPGYAGTAGVSNILKPSPLEYFGTVPSTGLWVPGYQGGKGAISFDKTVANRIHLMGTQDLFSRTNSVTVSCWIKTSDTGYNYLHQKWGQANGTECFHFRIDATTGLPYWTVSFNGNYQAANDLIGATAINDGKWHLIAASFDGITTKIYVDGKLDASASLSGTLNITSEVYFGGLSDGNLTGNWFTGTAEDIKVWNVALSDKVHRQMFDPATRWNLRRRPKTMISTIIAPPKPFTSMIGTTDSLFRQEMFALGADTLNVNNCSASNTLTMTSSVSRNIVVDPHPSNTLVMTSSGDYVLNNVIYILSGTTFVAPGDWPGLADTVESIGGGASGGAPFGNPFLNAGGGGGGGAYSKATNVTVANGATLQIGTGGNNTGQNGGDTWFNGTSLAASSCGAKGGTAGNFGTPSGTGGQGGQASAGIGSTKFSGGDGGDCSNTGFESGGGGGAAGPNGNGGNGANAIGIAAAPGGGGNGGGGNGVSDSGSQGGSGGLAWNGTAGGIGGAAPGLRGNGSQGSGGGGGSATDGSGGRGGDGNDFDVIHGSGGGGGGQDTDNGNPTGGAGGKYGGGGSGGAYGNTSGAGLGYQGVIRITYHTYIARSVSNTLTLSQSATAFTLTPQVSSTLTFSQTARGFNGTKLLTQSLVLSQSAIAHINYVRSASNAIVFHQVAEGLRIHPATNTLTFSQTADVDIGKGTSSTLVFTQTVTSSYYPHLEYPSNTLVFTQTLNKSVVKLTSSTLTFSQTATCKRIKFASASNLLVFNSHAETFKYSAATNTLTFSQTAIAHKITSLNVSHTLQLSQTLSRRAVYTFSLSNQLVFLHTYQKPTQINGILFNTPIPEVLYTKVRNRISFRTKDRAIVLLPPELDDGEGAAGKIVLQRTITGGTYVYARRTSTRKLKYVFETDQFKALEMRRFMLDCLSEPIWLENWKGEVWVGYFTTNPIEFKTTGRGSPCGDRYSFDIEFEGARIH
jgi:hypothetical protein